MPGSISGTVCGGAAKRAVLVGANVVLFESSGYRDQTLTDLSGQFAFSGLEAGRYQVAVDGSTSTTPGSWASLIWKGRTVGDGETIELASGEARELSVLVPEAAIIRGRITAGTTGIANVLVRWTRDSIATDTVRSSDGGYYRIAAIPGSSYVLSFGARDDSPTWREQWWSDANSPAKATPVIPREGQTLVLNVRLRQAVRV